MSSPPEEDGAAAAAPAPSAGGLDKDENNDLDLLVQLEQAMSSGKVRQLPNKEELQKAAAAAKAAQKAQNIANDLRTKAGQVTDPQERERLLTEAYEKEVEAHGNSKSAQRMASGAWQGAAGGAGIGGAVGVGVGTVVGALVGGIASIPTTGLGALVGTGVGAVHGPWIKFNEDGEIEDGAGEGMSEEEQHQAIIQAVTQAEEQEGKEKEGDESDGAK